MILNDFRHWYAVEGKVFVTVQAASEPDPEAVDAWDVPAADEYIEELEDTAVPDKKQQACDFLECYDSHVQLKKYQLAHDGAGPGECGGPS